MPLRLHHTHSWNLTPAEARSLQTSLRQYLRVEPLDIPSIRTVAGLDAGFSGDQMRVAVVLLSYPDLYTIVHSVIIRPVTFPYIPGLLSFRELPGFLSALEGLPDMPDVLLVDGHGYAHPRRFGIASHLGVLLDLPTIGCAKSILVGKVASLAGSVGNTAELVHEDEVIGLALRTRPGIKPIYLSVGQRVDLPSAVSFTMTCLRGHRLPEPSRFAHRLASKERTGAPNEH